MAPLPDVSLSLTPSLLAGLPRAGVDILPAVPQVHVLFFPSLRPFGVGANDAAAVCREDVWLRYFDTVKVVLEALVVPPANDTDAPDPLSPSPSLLRNRRGLAVVAHSDGPIPRRRCTWHCASLSSSLLAECPLRKGFHDVSSSSCDSGMYYPWWCPGIGRGAPSALSQEAHKEDLQKLPQGWLVNSTQTSAPNPKETGSRLLHTWITNISFNPTDFSLGLTEVPHPTPAADDQHGQLHREPTSRRCLARQHRREELVYPGFASAQFLSPFPDAQGRKVRSMVTHGARLIRQHTKGPRFEPGMAFRARATLLAKSAHGSLLKQAAAQTYGIEIKEVRRVEDGKHVPVLAGQVRTLGWPLSAHTYGGGWEYHMADGLGRGGRVPWTLRHHKETSLNSSASSPDALVTLPTASFSPIAYPPFAPPLTTDLMSSVALTGTNHAEGEAVHLRVMRANTSTQTSSGAEADGDAPPDTDAHKNPARRRAHMHANVGTYAGLLQRACPASVYEYVADDGGRGVLEEEGWEGTKLVINSQNCIHCKLCDIKLSPK
ncbi:hypothetical protein K438DRAFT_1961003 [Mycena galopus ATCC 62051]|nr:hypothetical protein K438DRAFT_1961003 [Mycena galopus ATCC 62051]